MTTLIILVLLGLALSILTSSNRHGYHSRPITHDDYIYHHDYRHRRSHRDDNWDDDWRNDYGRHHGNPVLAWIIAIVIFAILFFYVTA